MLNDYSAQYLAAQHRDELLRQAEQDRLAQAVKASDTAGRAAEAPDTLRVSLFAHIRQAVHSQGVAPAAGKSL